MTVSEPTTTQGKTIEDRVRDAGLPVLGIDQINSKKVKKALYRDREATFVLYGEDDAIVMSYDVQVDEEVIKAMQDHTVSEVADKVNGDGINYHYLKDIVKTTEYDSILRFLKISFSWYEDPARINGVNADFVKEREPHTEYFEDIALKMEKKFSGETKRELEEKYGFILVPVVSMDGQKTNRNPTGLKVTYQLAE